MEFTTYGGISIINAIPALLGGAVAVNLKVNVKVERRSYCITDEFVGFVVNYMVHMFNVKLPSDLCIVVNSEVPSGSGLKSNSAVATGIIYLLGIYLNLGIKPVDAARLAAMVTKAHGSSITGAFDDASASILGGAVLTDNASLRIIKQFDFDNEYTVVITGFKEGKRLAELNRLRTLSGIYRELFNMALNDPWRAFTINGMLVAESLGYLEAFDVIGMARKMGALASGVSGNGPAIFAVFKRGEEGSFIDFVNAKFGYYIVSNFINTRFPAD